MESVRQERIQYAEYAGGSLNIMLVFLQEELGKIARTPCQTPSDHAAVKVINKFIELLKQLDVIFPLYSQGSKPSVFAVGRSFFNLFLTGRSLAGLLENALDEQNTSNSALFSTIFFQAFSLIMMKLYENSDIDSLLNFLDPDSILIKGKIEHIRVPAKLHTYKINDEEVFLGDFFEHVRSFYIVFRQKFISRKVSDTDNVSPELDVVEVIETAASEFATIKTDILEIEKDLGLINGSNIIFGEGFQDTIQTCSNYRQRINDIQSLIGRLQDCKLRFRQAEKTFILQIKKRCDEVDDDFNYLNKVLKNEEVLNSDIMLTPMGDSMFNRLQAHKVQTLTRFNYFKQSLKDMITDDLNKIQESISENMEIAEHESIIEQLTTLRTSIPNDSIGFIETELIEKIELLIETRQAILENQKNQKNQKEFTAAVENFKKLANILESEISRQRSLTTSDRSPIDEHGSSISTDSGTSIDGDSMASDTVPRQQEALSTSSRDEFSRSTSDSSFGTTTVGSNISAESTGVSATKQKKTWKEYLGARSGEKLVDAYKRRRSSVFHGVAENMPSVIDVEDSQQTLLQAKSEVETLLLFLNSLEDRIGLHAFLSAPVTMESVDNFKDKYSTFVESLLINDLINDQINLLYKNTHIRKAVDGCPDIALSFRSLQEVVKDHLIQTFRNNVKSKFAVDDRVELLKAKIATAVQSYRELSDINIIINSYCDYEIRVEQLQSSCVDIKNELTSLAEIKNKIDEELRIDEDSLPDAAALDKLKGNLPLARMFNDAANSGVPVGKYVSVDSLTVGGQSLQVSLPSSTKNLCHQSFIHRVNLFLLDKDSVASPTDNVAEINFDSLIRTLTNDQLNEYVLEIDKCLKEMDGLLGNKYHLANAIALYLHEFISQPAEQQTKENLDKIISKCQHKLHSYDSEVAEQDKSLWERKLTIVIGIIPIIGQIVLAANYFYNKHTSGIGFFSWETSKKQDAQRKVDTALDALGEMMMVPTPTA